MNVGLFLQWCLQDFWRWLGLFFLVIGFGASIGGLVRIKNITAHQRQS
jgi:hypothetical protein